LGLYPAPERVNPPRGVNTTETIMTENKSAKKASVESFGLKLFNKLTLEACYLNYTKKT